MKKKSENENKNEFSFLFSFCFSFLFLLSKSFCIFVNSTWPRDAIDRQLSLDWPRSAIAFLLSPRGLEVPQMVNCLLIGLEVHFRLRILHVAQRCHRWSTLSRLAQKCISTQKYGAQPNQNMQNSVMLFTFFVFDRKYLFWANMVQKIKIVSLR